MINTVKSFAKVYKGTENSCGVLVILIKVFMKKIQHFDQVVVDRATRKATVLVEVKMRFNVRPEPLDEEIF